MQEIEIEFKNLLTAEEYNRLLTSLPFPRQAQAQVNYYFDTKDFSLQDHLCALRIRKKNDSFRLTLKEASDVGVLETHDDLAENLFLKWIQGQIIPQPNTTKQLNKLNVSPDDLRYYGSLVTKRREYRENDVLYVLDYSTYNGCSDYELEIEASSKDVGVQAFNQLLERFRISRKTTPNKIERFFSTYTPS
ncbi:MAG TPA: CYTH domain-containing protein [Bacillota bacterium]|nr:CYTH domain-containing protein [Bacillota bacterium]